MHAIYVDNEIRWCGIHPIKDDKLKSFKRFFAGKDIQIVEQPSAAIKEAVELTMIAPPKG